MQGLRHGPALILLKGLLWNFHYLVYNLPNKRILAVSVYQRVYPTGK